MKKTGFCSPVRPPFLVSSVNSFLIAFLLITLREKFLMKKKHQTPLKSKVGPSTSQRAFKTKKLNDSLAATVK